LRNNQELPKWLSASLIAGAFGVLLLLERRRPLRRAVESKTIRDTRNLAVAGLAAAAMQFGEVPATYRLTKLVERRKLGLLKLIRLPQWLEIGLAVLLLDYTLYLWHVLTHKVPFLWRFHIVHHIDLDLDASTALRFHFGEIAISIIWRAGQILVIGVSPAALTVWQMLLFVSILFHHSNVELPINLERKLVRLIVTPRMHGIHHSIVREETDSNWSSGLSIWDRLHKTLRLNESQNEITIGVPAYRALDDAALANILKLPFETQKSAWQLSEKAQNNQLT
jgi:sterol desaturase/sphingolipid hydroxylase (fatty acid hydroxylase superfamily)